MGTVDHTALVLSQPSSLVTHYLIQKIQLKQTVHSFPDTPNTKINIQRWYMKSNTDVRTQRSRSLRSARGPRGITTVCNSNWAQAPKYQQDRQENLIHYSLNVSEFLTYVSF